MAIYLNRLLPTGLSDLPRSVFLFRNAYRAVRIPPWRNSFFTWSCIEMGLSYLCISIPIKAFPKEQSGELLPRLFTLIPTSRDGIFSATLSVRLEGSPGFLRNLCSLMFGLSSPTAFKQRSDHPVQFGSIFNLFYSSESYQTRILPQNSQVYIFSIFFISTTFCGGI